MVAVCNNDLSLNKWGDKMYVHKHLVWMVHADFLDSLVFKRIKRQISLTNHRDMKKHMIM
jgi:hypothetical protein